MFQRISINDKDEPSGPIAVVAPTIEERPVLTRPDGIGLLETSVDETHPDGTSAFNAVLPAGSRSLEK